MGGIGGGSDIARRTPGSLQGLEADFCAFALDHLPRGVVNCHAVFADDEGVGIPETLGAKAGPAVIDRRHRVANGEAHLLADHRNAIEVGNAGIATAGMQIEGRSTTPYMFFIAKVTPDIW